MKKFLPHFQSKKLRKGFVVSSSVCAARTQTAQKPPLFERGQGRGSDDGLDLARVDVADHAVSKHLLSGLVADLGSVLTQEPADLSPGGLGVGAETVEPARGGDVDNRGRVRDEFNSTIGILTNGALGVGMIGKIYGSEHNFYFLSFSGGVPPLLSLL